MKTIQVAALLSLSVGSLAFGQQAVQWKVSDGGNGHWYARVPELVTWPEAKVRSEQLGGHLATLTSAGENNFAGALNVPGPSPNSWIGGFQDRNAPDFSEPAGGWRWVTGEAWQFTAWDQSGPAGGEPNNLGPYNEDYLCTWVGGNTWNDLAGGLNPGAKGYPFICEWSADCNDDGIVDYGQCRDGSLPDYNGNNIPDCCEQGTPCVVGSYPVQWRVSEGGNGHWYSYVHNLTGWNEARVLAVGVGGHLATISDMSENGLVVLIASPAPETAWIGGLQDSDACEPSCGWRWVTDEPWSFTAWVPGEPNNAGEEDALLVWPDRGGWNDGRAAASAPFVVEWSADCNNDGIVDKGQILRGQLADSDNDGIPNVCECVCDVFRDFNVNGIDLGILLGQWGPTNQFTVTDFNGDGSVDGSDLGQLLAAWGPCPN